MSSSKAIVMSGDLYVDILNDDGTSTGFQGLEADELKVTPKSKTLEETSRRRNTYGQTFAMAVIPQPTEFEVSFTEVSREILAAMLAGRISAFSQAAGLGSPVSIQAIADRSVPLGVDAISSAEVKDAAGVTSYVEGTDYTLDRDLGFIKVLPTGAIKTGDVLHVTPTLAASKGSRITGSTRYQFTMRIKLNGRNLVTGETVLFSADAALVTPDGAQDFLDDKFMKAKLKGRLNIPDGATEPYTIKVLDN